MNQKESIKRSFNLVEYIQLNSTDYIEEHRGVKMRCFIHPDVNPSMWVTDEGWYCFACNNYGDNVDFLQRFHNITYNEAISIIRDETFFSVPQREKPVRKKEYKTLDKSLADTYHSTLCNTEKKIDYYIHRGLERATIDMFKLGYGRPPSRRFVYPRFTIPIFDHKNTLVTIRYRKDDYFSSDEAKYIVYPETQSYLFNTGIITESTWAVLTGSQIDAMLLQQYGIPAIGSAGEGIFKQEWVELLNSMDIYVFFDNDSAGYDGSEKVCRMLDNAYPVLWRENTPKKYDINNAILDKDFGIEGVFQLINEKRKETRFLAGSFRKTRK